MQIQVKMCIHNGNNGKGGAGDGTSAVVSCSTLHVILILQQAGSAIPSPPSTTAVEMQMAQSGANRAEMVEGTDMGWCTQAHLRVHVGVDAQQDLHRLADLVGRCLCVRSPNACCWFGCFQ